MREDEFLKFYLIVMAISLSVSGAIYLAISPTVDRAVKRCEARGGVYLKKVSTCVRSDAFINLESIP